VSRRFRHLKNDTIYYVVRALIFMADLLPRQIGLEIFALFARILFAFPTGDRRCAIRNVRQVLRPDWTIRQAARFCAYSYAQLGRNLYDAFFLPKKAGESFNDYFTTNDLSAFDAATNNGKGVILITGHIGSFDLLLPYFTRRGMKGFTIGQRLYDKRLDELVLSMRKGKNIRYLYRDNSAREIVRLLREGWGFGVLIDQDTKVEGSFSPFLGKPAFTPNAPVRMGLRMSVPVFVGHTYRLPNGKHHIHFEGPIEPARADTFDKSVQLTLDKVNSYLSDAILAHPDQWVWMHDRWNRKPPLNDSMTPTAEKLS
jgi:KDO2-lipid IV(A) lauroyltransferase